MSAPTNKTYPTHWDLVEEAANVYTETGLTPSQLAAQRAELLAVLELLVWVSVKNRGAENQFIQSIVNDCSVNTAPSLAWRKALLLLDKATQTHQVIATAHHDPEINATIVTPEPPTHRALVDYLPKCDELGCENGLTASGDLCKSCKGSGVIPVLE